MRHVFSRAALAAALALALAACDRGSAPAPGHTEPSKAAPSASAPPALKDRGVPESPDGPDGPGRAPGSEETDAPDFVPTGSALIALRTIDLAVYLPTPVTPAGRTDIEQKVKTRFPAMTLLEKPEMRPPPTVIVFTPELDSLPIPSAEDLAHSGRDLTPAQVESVQRSKGALILGWLLDADPTYAELRKAQQLIVEVAQKGNGLIWDDITRELFSADSWKKIRIDGWQGDIPDAKRHFSTHYAETEEGKHRAVTLGLAKLGLPDLVVQDVPPQLSATMGALLGVVAQTMVEGGAVGAQGKLTIDLKTIHHLGARTAYVAAAGPSATLHGNVTLVMIDPEEGDADNRTAELRFDGYPGATDVEREVAALHAIFGGSDARPKGKPAP